MTGSTADLVRDEDREAFKGIATKWRPTNHPTSFFRDEDPNVRELVLGDLKRLTLELRNPQWRGLVWPTDGIGTAPSAGTGKSLLAQVLIAVVLGEVPPSAYYAATEEEREKRVGAAILEGWPALWFDNLQSGSFLGFRDVTLAKLVTDVVYSGRILGLTQTFSGPAGVVPVTTGNNIVVDGDLARRTLECRLEAPEGENLALRTFKHESLLKWTLENRGKILGAIQRVMQHKTRVKPIGSFPEWSRAVAHPVLKALDIPVKDFFGPWLEAAEEDAKGLQLKGTAELCQAIAALPTIGDVVDINGEWRTAGEIVEALADAGSAHVLMARERDGSLMDAKQLAFALKRSAGSTYETSAGKFRIHAGRAKLGSRTKWEERPVFRVKRYAAAKPAAPKSRGQIMACGFDQIEE